MRIHDTPEEAAFRAEARAWLEAHARRRTGTAADWSRGPGHTPDAERAYHERCRAWQATLFDGGWAGIAWPRAYGGRGGSAAEEILFAEELAAFDATSGFLSSTIALVGPALMHFGSDAQRRHHLPRLLRGDDVWCQLFSEPDAGSDLAALRTRARREPGGGFVVRGQKLWTTSAQYCDLGLLLARTRTDVPKHAGITCLIVDMRAPGVDVRPLVTSTGGHHFNEVFFDDVHVPADAVVGDLDGGWAVARTTLAHESVMIGSSTAGARGVAELAALARAAGLGDDPRARDALARSWIDERILDLFRLRMHAALRAGRTPDLDGSVMKVFWAESRAARDSLGLDLLGSPAGLCDGPDAPGNGRWQGAFLDFPMGTIGGGTCEVHRNGIAERVLGLPRDPRADRDVPFDTLGETRRGAQP